MKNLLTLVFAFLIFGTSPAQSADDVRIGIFGDAHGDFEAIEETYRQMRDEGVTHVIGMGDFVEWGGMAELHRVLAPLSSTTGVPKERVFLIPGNWEHETYNRTDLNPKTANAILRQYGHLVYEKYDLSGVVAIEGTRIRLSHFPQHEVPKQSLPPPQFIRRAMDPPGQAFILDTIARADHPSQDVQLAIIGHTHVRYHFVDPVSGKDVINAGVLHAKRKSPTEPRSFAIYYPGANEVRFHSLDQPGEILTVSLKGSPQSEVCEKLLNDAADRD